MTDVIETIEQKMPRHQRYYALHREEKLAKLRENYNNNPAVIAKRKEKEKIKAEKGQSVETAEEKVAKRAEKERIRQEKLELAKATSHLPKKTAAEFLSDSFPVCEQNPQ